MALWLGMAQSLKKADDQLKHWPAADQCPESDEIKEKCCNLAFLWIFQQHTSPGHVLAELIWPLDLQPVWIADRIDTCKKWNTGDRTEMSRAALLILLGDNNHNWWQHPCYSAVSLGEKLQQVPMASQCPGGRLLVDCLWCHCLPNNNVLVSISLCSCY